MIGRPVAMEPARLRRWSIWTLGDVSPLPGYGPQIGLSVPPRSCMTHGGTWACLWQRHFDIDHLRQLTGDALLTVHQLLDGIGELTLGIQVGPTPSNEPAAIAVSLDTCRIGWEFFSHSCLRQILTKGWGAPHAQFRHVWGLCIIPRSF